MDKTNKKLVEITPPKVILTDDDYDTFSDKVVTCEELEKQRIKDYDDDYADKVDTLVGNMVASDDNKTDKVYPQVDDVPDNIKKEWLYNYTHDSEGC